MLVLYSHIENTFFSIYRIRIAELIVHTTGKLLKLLLINMEAQRWPSVPKERDNVQTSLASITIRAAPERVAIRRALK